MSAAPSAPSALAPLVDELGQIELELLPFKARIKRAETLRAALRSSFAACAPGDSFCVPGNAFNALLGAKGNESVIDRPKLFALIGGARYVEVSSVTLTALQTLADVPAAAGVVSITATGTRPLAVVALPPVAAAPATKKGKRAK